ncbi:MAG: 4Fe-4S dicluster domain-containing protein [Candidatus Schekmanbacteria bacterium]|nr:MAG: 4Fe-4S dicluster domain-containing protein [Candidatus Schekmanbacteria bacterium]
MISFIDEKCTGCKICVKVCPQAVIAMIDGKAQLTDYQSCMECGACELNCEFNAVRVTKGTGCLIAIIKEDILKIAPKNTGCSCS